MSLALRRPKYWLGRAPKNSFVAEIAKARPCPPSCSYSGTIAKAKQVEKDKDLLVVEFLNLIGDE